MIKPVAIVGFTALILGSILINSRQTQTNEPINGEVNENFEAPTLSPTPNVELTEEAPIETKTTNSVPKPSPTPTASIKVADLIVPKTEVEQDLQIDQNTIKNVEQDIRLDNLETVVNTPAPTPDPVVEPIPQDSGTITCYGTDAKTIICDSTYQFTDTKLLAVKFVTEDTDPVLTKIETLTSKLIPNDTNQYAYQPGHLNLEGWVLKSLTYSIIDVEYTINFTWSSLLGKYIQE